MFRNLIDGIWFGLSMLAGAYIGAAVLPQVVNLVPEGRGEGMAVGAFGGAAIGGALWKWYEWVRKTSPPN